MARISITFSIDTNSPHLDEILDLIQTAERTAELEAEAAALVLSSCQLPLNQGHQHGNH